MPYSLTDGNYGKRMVFRGILDGEEIVRVCKEQDLKELDLSGVVGGCYPKIDFLTSIAENLQALTMDTINYESLKPIESLHNLRSIVLHDRRKEKIDFSGLPLEHARIFWINHFKSILNCTTLKDLFIYGYKGKNLEDFSQLKNIKSLILKTGSIQSLKGIEKLCELKKLELLGLYKLENIENLGKCKKIKYLLIDTSKKIPNIEPLKYLIELEKAYIDNCGPIESLRPILGLNKLELFYFVVSTNVLDGDIGCLLEMPNLKRIWYQNRKHYSHDRVDWHREKYPNQKWTESL